MKRIIYTLSVISLVSCQNKSDKKFDKLEKMNWLVGSWEQKLPEGTLVESWTKENDSTFSGKSYFVKDKDTIHAESIVLTEKNEKLLYIPTIKGQNNDEPVTFTMTSETENNYVFENSAHDYPQRIAYQKVDDIRLVATISGKQQGKQCLDSYPMKKK